MQLLNVINKNVGHLTGISIQSSSELTIGGTRGILITHNDPAVILEVNDWFIEHFSILRVMPDYGHSPEGTDVGQWVGITDAWLLVYA